MEIAEICLDITFREDRQNIIQKYLLPYLISKKLRLSDLDPELLSDIFNVLDEEQVEVLREQIEPIIEEFVSSEFVETKWKIGKCHNCDELSGLTKCKYEHDEECAYGEITDPEGCKNSFCDNCIFHVCAHEFEECPAIRCGNCAEE